MLGPVSQQELLGQVIEALEEARIDYMITGSFASSLQGVPRLTHDIDLVVSIQESSAHRLANAFPPPDYYLDEESIVEAVTSHGMFNLLSVAEGDKVDFWVLTEEPFDRSRFDRKQVEDFMGTPINVSSPEDTILAKLRWARLSGGSEKQFGDALGVYEVQRGSLDTAYIEQWLDELGLRDLWERLVCEARGLA